MSVIQLGNFVVVKLFNRTKSISSAVESEQHECVSCYDGNDVEESGTTYKLSEFDQIVEKNTLHNSEKSCIDYEYLSSTSVLIPKHDIQRRHVTFADDAKFLNRDEDQRKEFLLTRRRIHQSMWSRKYWRRRWLMWLIRTEKRLRVTAVGGSE